MSISFSSRLNNLREKKSSQHEEEAPQFKLSLPMESSDKLSNYEPTATFNNTRTSMRILKGRIDRGQSSEKIQLTQTNNNMNDSKGLGGTQRLTLPPQDKSAMKLVLNDDLFLQEKKPLVEPPKIPLQKRILIQKQAPKEQIKREEIKKEEMPPPSKIETKIETKVEQRKQSVQRKHEFQEDTRKLPTQKDKPIREEDVQESGTQQNENDLVLCPEGCGRKFNRKALEKHAKACKLVFMSKRKEFNSEAKRLANKQQAAILKQNKIKQRKELSSTKGKGFGKTGDNWKAASQDFRSAIKAMKKQDKDEKDENLQEIDLTQQKKVVTVICQYCEKQFNELFIETHLQNCVRKKQKEKKKLPPKRQ